MRLVVVFLGALLGLLAAQGTQNGCPHKKSATLLPSFTVTTHRATTPATTSHEATTAGHHATTTPSHGNATVNPTMSNSTATSPRAPTSTPQPGPPPPPPSPSPGSKGAVGDYMWANGSQPCVRLQAQIRIGILYPTQGGGEAWGTSVLNPNKTTAQGGCEGAHPHLLLSFPYGQLSFGFEQRRPGLTLPEWTFSVENASLRALRAPLGQSLSCGNASVTLSPALRLDLLHLKLQAARLPPSGAFGPSFPCPSDHVLLLPLLIGVASLGLLALVLAALCVVRRRPPAYQPL
ncbi:macrosialin [Crocuta crocuta]